MFEWASSLINKDNAAVAQGWAGIAQGFFAAVLVAVSAFQIAVYARMRKIMKQQSRIMRRQANISERGLIASQQPYIVVDTIGVEARYDHSPPDQFPPTGRFRITVYGQTPAIIRSMYKELLIAPTLNAQPFYRNGWTKLNIIRASTDGLLAEEVKLGRGYTVEDMDAIRRDQKSFFLIGRVIYEDIFGNEHDVGFCGRCGKTSGATQPYGGTAYNYRATRWAQDRPRGFAHDDPEPPTSAPAT